MKRDEGKCRGFGERRMGGGAGLCGPSPLFEIV